MPRANNASQALSCLVLPRGRRAWQLTEIQPHDAFIATHMTSLRPIASPSRRRLNECCFGEPGHLSPTPDPDQAAAVARAIRPVKGSFVTQKEPRRGPITHATHALHQGGVH